MHPAGLLIALLALACSSEALRSSNETRADAGAEADEVSCAPWRVEPWQLEAGEAFARSAELDFASCGHEHTRFGTQTEACCERITASRQCLFEAFARCTPASYTEVSGTIEGDPIVATYFVVPKESSCELVVVRDSSRDTWRGPGDAISTGHCRGVTAPAGARCARLQLESCAP